MENSTTNGFEEFEEDIFQIWVWKLSRSFSKINDTQLRHSKQELREPTFDLNDNVNFKWGSWNPSKRRITLSAKLLRNFEWEAVEYVLKHEVAHQIVSEIFEMDCAGVSHGEAWKRACNMVGIDPERCSSYQFLSKFKGTEGSPMVSKVRKIIIKANDSGATEEEEEAEIFMQKAREIMLRHDIEMRDVTGKDKVFVSRPFGKLYKRFPSYLWTLGSLLQEHYNIKHIRTYGPNSTKRLELFGEPDNLDIAEYVGHAILNQADILYERYKKEHKRKRDCGELDWHEKYHKLSKKAFMEGLLEGYSDKLRRDKEKAEKRVGEKVFKENALENGEEPVEGGYTVIPTYDVKLLNEMYRGNYPSMTNAYISGTSGMGRDAGNKAGSNLRLSKGVKSGGNSGRCLMA